jgi:hypothetical protein
MGADRPPDLFSFLDRIDGNTMATTRGKGGSTGGDTPAETAPRRTRTRAPEDEISGVAAPEAAAPPAKRARRAPGAGVAEAPPAEAPRPASRRAPGAGVASAGKAPGAAKKRGGQRETYAETAARRKKDKEVDQLQADLRAFVQARPAGWSHDDWVSFLTDLASRGHDVSDAERIGARLEQERLAVVLGSVQGLGPKRVQSLVERFHTLWSTRAAGADDLAGVAGMTRPLAERVAEELRTRYP